jgi:hypothetical protein
MRTQGFEAVHSHEDLGVGGYVQHPIVSDTLWVRIGLLIHQHRHPLGMVTQEVGILAGEHCRRDTGVQVHSVESRGGAQSAEGFVIWGELVRKRRGSECIPPPQSRMNNTSLKLRSMLSSRFLFSNSMSPASAPPPAIAPKRAFVVSSVAVGQFFPETFPEGIPETTKPRPEARI